MGRENEREREWGARERCVRDRVGCEWVVRQRVRCELGEVVGRER